MLNFLYHGFRGPCWAYDAMSVSKKILIAGAGASGLVAALCAARAGARVTVSESGKSAGRKIMASGNGRCNLSNTAVSEKRYHGATQLAARLLRDFGWPQAGDFFSGLGVSFIEEEEGKVFTSCGRSRAVLDALLLAVAEAGGTLLTDSPLLSVKREQGGLRCRFGTREELFDSVVLACGSCAYPQLGGGSSGYELARSLGHTVSVLTPAQVPLCVKEKGIKRLKGIRAQGRLKALQGGREIASASGEILFTDYGISGPCTLDLSRDAVRAIAAGPVMLSMDLSNFSGSASEFFSARAKTFPARKLKEFLSGLFHESIINLICDRSGSLAEKEAGKLSPADMALLAELICGWKLELSGPLSWREAMVCAGGVLAEEVNETTLESLKTPGVYLCGELLDVDGDCGGFNLHFAWASGRLAGNSAARV